MQVILCKLYYASYIMQVILCKLYYASYIMQVIYKSYTIKVIS
jgi:hypothetical protein